MAGAPVSWSSRLQPTTALSSVEAEYLALSDVVKEVLWFREMLRELGFPPSGPTTINVDNTGAISLAKNPVAHQRTKHIDIRHHFIRDHIEAGDIEIQYVNTKDNKADWMTKSLGGPDFLKFRSGQMFTIPVSREEKGIH